MKRMVVIFISISICMFFLNSCGDDKEQKIKELRHQIQIEQQMKEKARQDAAQTESNFNLFIGISIAIVILVLIVGVAMGSKARKDANEQSIMNDGKSND